MQMTVNAPQRVMPSGPNRAASATLRERAVRMIAELPAATLDRTLAWNWEAVEARLGRFEMILEDMKAMPDAHEQGDDGAALPGTLLAVNRHLAAHCEAFVGVLSCRFGCNDVRSLRAIAFCLHYIGEAFKHARNHEIPFPISSVHALWKLASASGHESNALCLPLHGEDRLTSIDRLYVRTLALAWGGQNGLTPAQMQVFDGWIWTWLPTLECSRHIAEGSVLRPDPQAPSGARVHPADPMSLDVQVPLHELESAFRILSGELAAGRTMPGMEVEPAVLEEQRQTLAAIQQGIRAFTEPPPGNNAKRASDLGSLSGKFAAFASRIVALG